MEYLKRMKRAMEDKYGESTFLDGFVDDDKITMLFGSDNIKAICYLYPSVDDAHMEVRYYDGDKYKVIGIGI